MKFNYKQFKKKFLVITTIVSLLFVTCGVYSLSQYYSKLIEQNNEGIIMGSSESISFINYSYNVNNSSYLTSVDKPANTQDGDIIFLLVESYRDITSAPSGFTLINSLHNADYVYIYYKIASSEGGSYSFTFSSNTSSLISAYTFRNGFNAINPIGNTSYVNYNNVSGSSITIPSFNVILDNSPVLIFNSIYNASGNSGFSPPTSPVSFTEIFDYGSLLIKNYQESSYTTLSAGDTGTITTTFSPSGSYKAGFAISLNPPTPSGNSNFFMFF